LELSSFNWANAAKLLILLDLWGLRLREFDRIRADQAGRVRSTLAVVTDGGLPNVFGH
jgi:hypothetical protein